jgi:hypothetical protein
MVAGRDGGAARDGNRLRLTDELDREARRKFAELVGRGCSPELALEIVR